MSTACATANDATLEATDSTPAFDSVASDTANDSAIVDTFVADTAVADTYVADSGSADSSDDVMEASTDTPPTCTAGAVEERACGKCGKQSRLCDGGAWLAWSSCGSETGACLPGDTRPGTCGFCGTHTETCTAACVWSAGACTGEGGCAAGATETQYGGCLDGTQIKTRACSVTCTWSVWSDCH
ncbi:MAG: hypothetical protein ACXVEE_42050 [Polyangiales bacterium]